MNLYDMGVSHEMILKITKGNIVSALNCPWIYIGEFAITRMQWENQGGE
jgi:hypothetical protein